MELLPLQFAALKLVGQLINLKDGSKLLHDELLPKEKNGLFLHVLHLIIAAGGTANIGNQLTSRISR